LLSYQSKFDSVMRHEAEFTVEEFRGFGLVNNQTRGDCLHCHPTDGNGIMTTFAFSNNGIDSVADAKIYTDKGRGAKTGNERDNGKFKVPSLRNIALSAPYMHDGRFKSLEEVVEFYSSGVQVCANIDPKMEFAYQHGARLNEQEKKNIVAFLKTLTDSVFVRDKAFGNPFSN
jgi:cytochrome c peroxidase